MPDLLDQTLEFTYDELKELELRELMISTKAMTVALAVHVPQNDVSVSILQALTAFFHLNRALRDDQFRPFSVTVSSDLPVGAGLGSSASFSVCMATALLLHYGHITGVKAAKDLELINNTSFLSEKVIHSNPSGVDNTVCVYGGALSYHKNSTLYTPLKAFKDMQFLLTNTKAPRQTSVQVGKVQSLLDSFPSIVNPILEAIDNIALEFKKNPRMDDEKLKRLIQMNHQLLCTLGVGHHELDNVYKITARYGLATKLTGAGGGGCALTYLDDEHKFSKLLVVGDLEDAGMECFDVVVGCQGVQLHHE